MENKFLTTFTKEKIPCPKCKKEQILPKYTRINVTEKKELKQKILKNEMFLFSCDECGLTAPLTYDCIYVDRDRKLVIGMSPDQNEEWKKELSAWEEQRGYTKRVVDNLNDLKEKIMIADNLLDDRVIEFTKITYLKQLEKEMQDDTLQDILFDYSKENLYFIVFFEKRGMGRIPLSVEYYRGVEQTYGGMIRDHSTDEFMKVDMQWAGDIMFRRN